VGLFVLVSVWDGPLHGKTVEGITFASKPGQVFVPVKEGARALRWELQHDDQGRCKAIEGLAIEAGSLPRLIDGSELVQVSLLAKAGARLEVDPEDEVVNLQRGWWRLRVPVGAKRVVVSLPEQRLRAWQGDRLVLETKISSGRYGRTPAGEFVAGPYKSRTHFSSLYDNAPMPWSVQINGHVFIHGFSSVPDYPASHGCIRMPLDGGNPAKWFFEWVDVGTPVSVQKATE
jgi:lipoprotein-anchoring transpeptidase ErfK/SrfK